MNCVGVIWEVARGIPLLLGSDGVVLSFICVSNNPGIRNQGL